MTLKQINLNTDRKRILKVLNMQKEIIKAKGPYLYDANGSKYLDFTSQYGVHLFGHNPDFLWNELTKLKHESPPNMIQPLENQASNQLADLLIQITPGDMSHVTLTNSGSETVEVAIKMARSRKKKFKILSTTNSYHGKTLGAVLATGNSSYRDAFHPKDPYFQHIPFNDIDTLEEHLSSNDIAAFIVEPIQGEGGINVPADNYLKSCQELCNKYNTLFIVDEIQTGLGRTGDLFACQQQQVEPDIILLSKSLGGGLVPIGACICNKKAWTVEFGIKHSSTFSNNHISSTIALSTINHLLNNPDILLNVQKNGKYLSEQLRKLTLTYPSVFHQNSGRGLLQGIKVHPWKCEDSYFPFTMNNLGLSVPLISSFLLNQHGILTAPTLTSHHTLRLQPNLLIKQSQIERLICGLNDLGDIISKKQFSKLISTAAQIPLAPHSTKTKHTTPPTLPIKISTEKKLGTFSFFIHPTTEDDLIDGLPSNTLCPLDTDSKNKLQQWMSSLKDIQKDACPVYYLPYLPSKKGGYVDGWLISSFLTPKEMIQLPRKEKLNLLSSYIDHAKAVNADIIGLGAFTSVISRSGTLIEHCDIPITTGNSFTALTCTKSVKLTCNQLDRNLSKSSVAIVGAKGSVGRLAALDISQNCKSLFLIGNPENKNAINEL
ncbi:MAG: aminotransferase III, partial [Actinobacteria bacterium]|nr:aminotransferase III [Actinomycetota bacterium]